MYVRELIEILEGCEQDAEVRLAFQPNYPLEYHLGVVEEVAPTESVDDDDEDDDNGWLDDDIDATIVYLGEGGQVGYLPGAAASALGWE